VLPEGAALGIIAAAMVERSPARLLAPVALVAFAAALVLVISTSGGRPSSSSSGANSKSAAHSRPTRATYVVKPGDTLSKISLRTGLSVERLEALNPDLDPIALAPGQRIKLRP
jgi:LysM repeat protein